MAATPALRIVYDVLPSHPAWELDDEDPMPESLLHDAVIELLKLILKAWVAREGRNAIVGSNLAVRWDPEHPKVGVDPDVYLVEPPPPGSEAELGSLLLWKPGHHAPRIAVEVVSENHPEKDYVEGPDKYAACGATELWVFDPLLAGPRVHGGPHRLQVWCRTTPSSSGGEFRRVYAGEGPVRSTTIGAWLVVTDGGHRLRIAQDEAAKSLWPTDAEAEHAAREAAEAEVVRLRIELDGLKNHRRGQ